MIPSSPIAAANPETVRQLILALKEMKTVLGIYATGTGKYGAPARACLESVGKKVKL